MFTVGVNYSQGDHRPCVRAPKGCVPVAVNTLCEDVEIEFGTRVERYAGEKERGFPDYNVDFVVYLRFEDDEMAMLVADQLRKGIPG